MTSNQTLVVTLVTIVGLVVLIALHDLSADVGVPIIATLAGAHIGGAFAIALPGALPMPGASTTTEVTQVTGNAGK